MTKIMIRLINFHIKFLVAGVRRGNSTSTAGKTSNERRLTFFLLHVINITTSEGRPGREKCFIVIFGNVHDIAPLFPSPCSGARFTTLGKECFLSARLAECMACHKREVVYCLLTQCHSIFNRVNIFIVDAIILLIYLWLHVARLPVECSIKVRCGTVAITKRNLFHKKKNLKSPNCRKTSKVICVLSQKGKQQHILRSRRKHGDRSNIILLTSRKRSLHENRIVKPSFSLLFA